MESRTILASSKLGLVFSGAGECIFTSIFTCNLISQSYNIVPSSGVLQSNKKEIQSKGLDESFERIFRCVFC